MTPSDRGPEIQHRLEELKDEFLSDFWCVHGDRCAGECSCEQDAVKHEATIRDAQAEIQRLTGELAQARKELREQDTEADRLTRELIQAQGELAQARAERDAALDAWRRMNEMHSDASEDATQWMREEVKEKARADAMRTSQQGLRAALEQLKAYAAHDLDCTELIAPCSCGLQQTLAQVDAALAAPPCGDETPR
jgi:DNA repair exonuclease SbcCD ATPase subunit